MQPDGYQLTREIAALLSIPQENRRHAWFARLASCLPHATFEGGTPELVYNPDGFTYFSLELPQTKDDKQPYTILELAYKFVLPEGVGVIIEARDPEKTLDLSYGDILGLTLNGSFGEPNAHLFKTDGPRCKTLPPGTECLLSEPPESVLPSQTKALLLEIMAHYEIKAPEIKLAYLPAREQHELLFSITPQIMKSTEAALELSKRIGWFLPRYYAYLCCDIEGVKPVALS